MNTAQMRKMKVEEIEKEITQAYVELKNTRDEISSGKEKDVSKSLKIRRNIARMLTVLNEMRQADEQSNSKKEEK